jgi:opacity protein-like surface antigen
MRAILFGLGAGLTLCLAQPGLAADASGAPAAELPNVPLPSMVGTPQANPWTGLYAGTEVVGFSGGHMKGFGGAGFAGYNHEFDNKLVVGIEGSVGYLPISIQRNPFIGSDFAATRVKLGYDLGRLMPYVTVGALFAKPKAPGIGPGYLGPTDSLNTILNSPSHMQTLGSVGAGFDYAVTDKLTFGLSVSAVKGHGQTTPIGAIVP